MPPPAVDGKPNNTHTNTGSSSSRTKRDEVRYGPERVDLTGRGLGRLDVVGHPTEPTRSAPR